MCERRWSRWHYDGWKRTFGDPRAGTLSGRLVGNRVAARRRGNIARAPAARRHGRERMQELESRGGARGRWFTGRRNLNAGAAAANRGSAYMIMVLLSEDQGMVRGALSALLKLEDDIEVLRSCADGATAWSEVQRLRPDVIVSDIEMPGLTGLELAMRVQENALPCKLVIVTTFARPGYQRRAQDAGVVGFR